MPFDLKNLRIGTRGSALAMTQSTWVKDEIEARLPGSRVSLVKITTQGDKILDVPLAKVGGKGLFVKEIEEALLRGEIDLAVHSMKDVPTDLPPALHIGITTKREDPRDVLISKEKMRLADLPLKARIGTSSLRRSAQLLAYRGDLEIVPLRGNLDTRIRKLKTESLHAVIVAAAGINRMGIKDVITEYLPVEIMLPAIGQGALGIELRREDKDLLEAISFLNHTETAITVRAERSYLKRLEGGCQVPIGAFGEIRDGQLILRGIVADPSGVRFFKKDMIGSLSDPESLGTALAEDILGMGARQVLEEVYERTLN
ncbi:MAG: hydroxymethylbilane synthase [Deltaproteobacteria bacterium]|nr:hydroxymethylbilane synthase [Deltaproteobacteria bacterium]